jgi:hypothetical protein
MYQDNPGASHHSGTHIRRHLKVYNISLSIGILYAKGRLPSPCHRQEPLLQDFGVGCGQAQHRLEHVCFMVPNSVGGVQTIITQFFNGDNGAITVWELHTYFVFENSAVCSR